MLVPRIVKTKSNDKNPEMHNRKIELPENAPYKNKISSITYRSVELTRTGLYIGID